MQFTEIFLAGTYLINPEPFVDERGFFSRSFCQKEFAEHGLKDVPVQCNLSFNKKRGTLRGMHFQRQPCAEAKLVRCTAGAICDVIIDLRKGSPTFSRWEAFELTAENRTALYIPEGFAHGFQTLVDNTEVFYQMYSFFEAKSADGVRWDDPAFNIQWPVANPVVSAKDQVYIDFDGFVL